MPLTEATPTTPRAQALYGVKRFERESVMTIPARQIILDAQVALNDPDGTRWPADELVRHLNRAQKEVCAALPNAAAVIAVMPLVAGSVQRLPDAAASLIDVPANASGEPISKVNLLLLDAVDPNWSKRTPVQVIRHVMHDLRTPKMFRVYPPAANGAAVQIEYAAELADIAVPTGKTHESVQGDVALGASHGSALLALVLHYAYAKDAEYGGNAALSMAYLNRAQSLMGLVNQSSAAVAPTS